MLIQIILATILVSLISFTGLLISNKKIKKNMHYMIAFAAAALLSVSFFDLIPQALEHLEKTGINQYDALVWVVAGIVIFFLLERFIHWHHCGKDHCHKRSFGILMLTGDFVHNFLDGVLIAGAFLLDTTTGIITAITVAIHEIPQEFGDFAVLLHAGYSKKRALFLNFMSALPAVLGGILGYFILDSIEKITPYAVLLTAGGFLYIALSDIMPALHKHSKNRKTAIIETGLFILAVIGFKLFLEVLH